jgi:predicted PurR-regulated permease PerM
MIQPEGESQSLVTLHSGLWTTSWWKWAGALALSLVAGFGLLAIIALFARPIALLFLAVCIAAALSPLVEQLSKRLPRKAGIILIYALLVLCAVIIVALLIPPLISQIKDFVQRLPEILERVRQFLNQNGISGAQIDTLTTDTAQIGQNLITAPILVFSTMFDAVLVLIVSLYLLMDAPKIRRFVLSLFDSEAREHIDAVGSEMLEVSGGYIRGIVINVILVGTITTVGLTVIGLPFALVLGAIAGLFEMLPTVGTLIAAVPILLIALLQSPTTALMTVVFVIILQLVQGNIISPNVMKGQAEVPQFIVPLAILGGGVVGGVLGALIAVPFIAMLRVFILRVAAPFIRKHTGAVDERRTGQDITMRAELS